MIIQSTQSMSFSGASAESENVVLKTSDLFTGLRMTVTATAGHVLDQINSIEIDVPDYGTQSARIKLAGNEVYLLPLICQMGNSGQADATASTGTSAITGQDVNSGYSHFDLPINKLALDKDVRVTINATAGAGETLAIDFGFLDTPFRSVYFRTYDVASATGIHQNWFPSDGTLQGIIFGTTAGVGACTSGSVFTARADNIREISLDGLRNQTFNKVQLLAPGLDEIVSGGDQMSFGGVGIYGMLRNFTSGDGPRYVSIDRSVATGLLVIGVMSDA